MYMHNKLQLIPASPLLLSCVVPYLDSPVCPTGGKHTLVEGVPANSMHCHVVGLGGWRVGVWVIPVDMDVIKAIQKYLQAVRLSSKNTAVV